MIEITANLYSGEHPVLKGWNISKVENRRVDIEFDGSIYSLILGDDHVACEVYGTVMNEKTGQRELGPKVSTQLLKTNCEKEKRDTLQD